MYTIVTKSKLVFPSEYYWGNIPAPLQFDSREKPRALVDCNYSL